MLFCRCSVGRRGGKELRDASFVGSSCCRGGFVGGLASEASWEPFWVHVVVLVFIAVLERAANTSAETQKRIKEKEYTRKNKTTKHLS